MTMDATNRMVLDAFDADILRPEIVDRVIANVVAALRPSVSEREARRTALKFQRATVEQEIERSPSRSREAGI